MKHLIIAFMLFGLTIKASAQRELRDCKKFVAVLPLYLPSETKYAKVIDGYDSIIVHPAQFEYITEKVLVKDGADFPIYDSKKGYCVDNKIPVYETITVKKLVRNSWVETIHVNEIIQPYNYLKIRYGGYWKVIEGDCY